MNEEGTQGNNLFNNPKIGKETSLYLSFICLNLYLWWCMAISATQTSTSSTNLHKPFHAQISHYMQEKNPNFLTGHTRLPGLL